MTESHGQEPDGSRPSEGDGPSCDIELSYIEEGLGEPLILLHGNGEDGTYFGPQIEHFKERFRVIAVDTRGHGKSPRGARPFTLGQFAEDLAVFMDAHGLETAHLLGFSDGANIALLFALAHPDRVQSMVLNGGNLFPEGLVDQARREDEISYEVALETGDERQLELLRLMMDEPHISPEELADLQMPVLVIAGTDDLIEEEHTRLIARSIPGARLRFVEGDHYIAAGNPEVFNVVVDEFYDHLNLREADYQ